MMCDVWAMQSAWMLQTAAAMQAWQAYNFEGEDDDYTWQGWQDHIAAELLRIASEGLSVISDTIWPEEYLRVELMNIRETFTYVKYLYQHSQGYALDDLELRAASSLKKVDELLQHDRFWQKDGTLRHRRLYRFPRQ